MKGLIILGVARAGKSTLADRVARKIGTTGVPVSLFAADAMMGGMQSIQKSSFGYACFYRPLKHIMPWLARRYHARLQRDLVAFLARALREQGAVSTVIFEGCYLTPSMAIRMFDPAEFRIVGIGYPNADIAAKMRDIRKYDVNTPAARRDDARLTEYIRDKISNSRHLAAECQKYNIPFIDTSTDYHGQIQAFVDNVIEFLK